MKEKTTKRRKLQAFCLMLLACAPLNAQEDGLRMHFDFENVSGTSVPDAATSGITATLQNQATVNEMGQYHVLNLGDGTGYLDMTEQAGELFRGLDTYTISMYYRVGSSASLSGNGFFLWAFSTSDNSSQSEGRYSAYRLNAQRFANSTGGWNNESVIEIGGASAQGQWMHVLYTQDGSNGALYLNGQQQGTSTEMPANSTNFTTTVPYAWIGRSPFSGDTYLTQTLVSDIRLYDRVLTTDEISSLAAVTDELDYAYEYGTPGDFTSLTEAIASATEFIASHGSEYTAAAVALFQDEINMAQDLVNKGQASQEKIEEQISSLSAAQEALEAMAGFEFDLTGITEGYDTERGFRHPGGLHTDEDFERVRRQIDEGNELVTAAYNTLLEAAFSQSSANVDPVETIVRGGGVGENYIAAAQAASIAYQNALRWKIDGTTDNADNAVRILNAWARTTTLIGGDSNFALASGLYGYAFANAAELMRDYEGWETEDFESFRRWMLDVWYPPCIAFLRVRNGTWENSGTWWQCPGHYWSNWGLCNALAVVSIGVLCDDVFIYNQGMSFFKYDQVGTFEDPRTADPILNDGLTEFMGNLVVTTTESELETGAYGKLGQMQESGRDGGHAAMAAGLAVDLAHIGWNQGDDLFSYMDYRLAAGIEFLAAQTQSVEGLPWTNYHYANRGYYWTDARSWLMTEPVMGAHIRPYWGTVIGHYEGVKGVKMPFSEMAYEDMGIDGGGAGSTSGGYDHMGYSVLMNTRDEQLAPAEKVPTPLTPVMEYNGTRVEHNELGGLVNTFENLSTETLPAGTVVTLSPQLPDSVTDTGLWEWSTGETSKDLTVVADRSGVWRVTYTNENGVKSEQGFTIAVEGDCEETTLTTSITYNGSTSTTTEINVFFGSEVTLSLDGAPGGFGFYTWETGSTESSITLPNVTTSRDVSVIYTNQGARKQLITFTINVQYVRPDIIVNGTTYTDTQLTVVSGGDNVTLTATPADGKGEGEYLWSDGSTGSSLDLGAVTTSGTYTLEYTVEGETTLLTYQIYVQESGYASVATGDYYIRHTGYDTYLTNNGSVLKPTFEPLDDDEPLAQQWTIGNTPPTTAYTFTSRLDDAVLDQEGAMDGSSSKNFRFSAAVGAETYAIMKSVTSGERYWSVDADGTINFAASTSPTDYPFELIPVSSGENIETTEANSGKATAVRYYTLDGILIEQPRKGINLRQTIYDNGQVKTDKIVVQ